jgi:uncharacterized protein
VSVVLDTNIYISALNFGGPPKRLLDLAVSGDIIVAISAPILNEITRVLRVQVRVGAGRTARAELLITGITRFVAPTETVDAVKADADDNRILECAVAAGASAIISGDGHLLDLDTFRGIDILTPAAFLKSIEPDESDPTADAG